PDAKVKAIGYSLGSGVHGDGIIKKISLGCTDYTFGFVPPTTPTNLRLEDHNSTPIACGGYTNFNYITPKWDAVAGATSYNYKVTLPNGSTYGPTNVGNVTSVSGAFGGEGLSTFSVQAVNGAGETSDWANACAITYDPTAPVTPTLLTPPNNSFVNTNDFYFTWSNTSDSGSPVKYEFQSSLNGHTNGGVLDTGVWNNIANGDPSQNNLTTPQIHSTGAPDGTWYWQVRAFDAAGNKSAWSSVWNVTIDTAGPVAPTNLSWKTSTNVVVPNNGTTNVADGTASWVASSSSDVDHYIYKYWNDIPANQYKVGSEYTTNVNGTSLAGVFNQGEGTHHFCVVAVDHAGNQSACSAPFTITYDHTGPAVDDNFTVNMGTGDKVTLSPTVTGDSPVTYLWSVSDSKLLNNSADSLTSSSLKIGPAPKGTYTVTVKVTDAAGNATTKTYTVTITPGNSNSAGAGQNTTQPQTLGATTTSTTTGSSSSTPSNSGKVKGDSTTKPDTTVNFVNASSAQTAKTGQSSFLGLGWWWLPLVAIALGFFFWFFLGRRSQENSA
ncbi:MAG: PKD domain-containing protein, partial [Candidatus Saccharimonadales bacterium]